MEDRGENIVFLARQILESDIKEPLPQKKTISVTMSFRTLCFTTLLAAASGNLMATLVHERVRPLNRYEKVELQALVYYAAKMNGMDEQLLRLEVGKRVGVKRFEDISAKEFPIARRFLQDKAQ